MRLAMWTDLKKRGRNRAQRFLISGTVSLPCTVIALLLIFPGLCGAQKRAMIPGDVLGIHSVSSASISPDGQWVLYTVGSWQSSPKDASKPGKEKRMSHLWLVSTAPNPAARQITFGEDGESDPAWSRDGKWISFLAARENSGDKGHGAPKRQVWIMRADGGEAMQLTNSEESVGAYAWSPDNSEIAYTAKVPLPKEVEAAHKRGDNAQVYEGDFPSLNLYVIDVASKKCTNVTKGQTFTIEGEPSWSADGKQIVFGAKPTPMIRDYRSDIYVVTAASKSLEKITNGGGANDSPRWSPDGATIAYLELPNDMKPLPDGIRDQNIGNDHLMLYHVATRKIEDVYSAKLDLGIGEFGFGDLVWTPDSKGILFSLGDHVYNEAFLYVLAAHDYRQLTHEKDISFTPSGAFSRDGSQVAYTMQSPTQPSEIYVANASLASPRKLTDTNPQVRDFALGAAKVIQWKSSDGWPIEGILIEPANYQSGKKYPLLVEVHGGPTEAYTDGFHGEEQMWASRGWSVLLPNPRGSTNYGEKFMRANILDWGGGDYRDIMTGTDAVIARGIADPNRLAEDGWSYGGYMTCWIVSQTSRFKAARMGAGISDNISMQGSTDIPGYISLFFGGYPSAANRKLYIDRSGVTYADHVTTPLLILQGGSDVRVPIDQSKEFFRALKERGKTVELVFYPGEGHGLQGYYHQYDRIRRTYNWINKYTLGTESTLK
jgi:dipeptidyl aminopeptidase/acylaminoacyl peptidase